MKVASLVGGMVAGADSIEYMANCATAGRGAKRLIGDAVQTARRLLGTTQLILAGIG